MMVDLIRNAVNRLKKVSIGVWFVCALVVLVGGWLIAVTTKSPSAEELQRRADHEYYQRYNKFLQGEKTPEYDSKTYDIMKLDGRYFLVPRAYSSAFGFTFFWPKELESFYRSTVSRDEAFNTKRNLAAVLVFMSSKRSSDYQKLTTLDHHECMNPANIPLRFKWNEIIIGFVLEDRGLLKEWPKICQEAIRILGLVKEVKNHE